MGVKRMRRALIISGILLVAILLGACASAPAPVPNPVPPSQPAPTPTPKPNLPGVGDMVAFGDGAFITVESFENREDLGFISVLIDNSAGAEDVRVDFQMSFLVEDKEGNTARIDMDAERDYPAPQGMVSAGDKLRGTLVYQIGALGEGLSLFFAHDISEGYIRIALE